MTGTSQHGSRAQKCDRRATRPQTELRHEHESHGTRRVPQPDLDDPLRVIATLRRDGSPHAVPVWYRWNSGAVACGRPNPAVGGNVLRDPRAAFSLQTFEGPYPAVMIRGRATVVTADDACTVVQARAITRRHVAAKEVDGYVAAWPNRRTIVTMAPDHVVS